MRTRGQPTKVSARDLHFLSQGNNEDAVIDRCFDPLSACFNKDRGIFLTSLNKT
jgi:hypothetical protein